MNSNDKLELIMNIYNISTNIQLTIEAGLDDYMDDENMQSLEKLLYEICRLLKILFK